MYMFTYIYTSKNSFCGINNNLCRCEAFIVKNDFPNDWLYLHRTDTIQQANMQVHIKNINVNKFQGNTIRYDRYTLTILHNKLIALRYIIIQIKIKLKWNEIPFSLQPTIETTIYPSIHSYIPLTHPLIYSISCW